MSLLQARLLARESLGQNGGAVEPPGSPAHSLAVREIVPRFERNAHMANRKWGGGLADDWLPRPRGRNGRPGGVVWAAEGGRGRARLEHDHHALHGGPPRAARHEQGP